MVESHVHEVEDDAFLIIDGELTFDLPDGAAVAGPGTFVLVPPGVEHGFANHGTEPVGCSTSTLQAASTGGSGLTS